MTLEALIDLALWCVLLAVGAFLVETWWERRQPGS
jgi:hypothetical protein